MKELEITEKNLDIFISNLRKEDEIEFKYFYSDSLDEFYEICLDKNLKTYFVANDDGLPLALGGAYELSGNNLKIAKVWLLATNEIYKNKLALYKYVKRKLSTFKKEYDVLYNYIYESNFASLNLLFANGFNVLNVSNLDFKLFYFLKGDLNFDLRYFACQ